MRTKHKAVVLLSGGMDSATALFHALSRTDLEVGMVMHFSYGQRGESHEWRMCMNLANHARDKFPGQPFGLLRQYINIPASSALIDTGSDLDPLDRDVYGQPVTFVPGRNLIFISYATAAAYMLDANCIIGGWSGVDVDYPDCSEEFLLLAAAAASCALGRSLNPYGLQVYSPISHLSKVETVKLGEELGVPWELTRSCYANTEYPCLECDSCKLRTNAFIEAGVRDPLVDDDTWAHICAYSRNRMVTTGVLMEDAT